MFSTRYRDPVAMTDSIPSRCSFYSTFTRGPESSFFKREGGEWAFRLDWIESSGHTFASGNLHLHLLPFRTASVVGERFFFGPHWGVHIVS